MVGSDLSQLFDHLPVGIYRATADGRVVAANRTLVEMLGYGSFDELALRAHRDGAWHHADGAPARLRENVRTVRGADGDIEFYEGVVEQGEAPQRSRRPVRPLVTLLARAAKTMLSAKEANAFLCRVLSAALRTTGAPYGIALFPTNDRNRFRAACASRTDSIESGAILEVSDEFADAIARGVPALLDGRSIHTAVASAAPRVCIAPLVVDNRTLGVLCLGIADPHAFRGDDLGTLAAFATIAALAIDRWSQFDRLFASEARYRALVENAHDPMVMTDGDGTIQYVNSAVHRVFGWAPPELLQRPLRMLMPEKATAVRRDGSKVPLEVDSSNIVSPDGALTTWTLRDVSKTKQQAEQHETLTRILQTVAREWVATFDAVDSPMLILDSSDFRIRRLNRAARELFGASYGDLVGKRIDETNTAEPWLSAAELCRRAAASGASETMQLREEQSKRTWDLSVTGGRAQLFPREEPFLILILRDITGLVELQEANRRSEVLGVLGAIVGGVAHEVRNPLFAISATVDAFEKEIEGRDEFAEYVAVLRGELERLSTLMQDLLAFGRPPTRAHCPASLEEVIFAARQQCIAAMQERGVRVEVQTSGDTTMHMDEQRMAQLFHNLIDNAIRHSPAGSIVEVRAFADAGLPHIHCQVVDEGPGFAPADLARAFEPFYSRRSGGTGLGLPLVQRIVDEHHGSITLANATRGGAVADLVFPVGAR